MNAPRIRLALVDDHVLFRKGLRNLLETMSTQYKIVFEAENGLELMSKLETHGTLDLIIMDINMPEMNGYESVTHIKANYPELPVLVISMINKEESIVQMLKLGVKGYLGKDIEPVELNTAIQAILNKGFYYTDFVTGKLIHSIQESNIASEFDRFTDREQEFIRLACSELTYYEIADEMCLSPKTIDGYRSNLFEKLNLKSRVGLALLAVKNSWVKIE